MPDYEITTTSGYVFHVTAEDMDDAFDQAWLTLEDEENDELVDGIASARLLRTEI